MACRTTGELDVFGKGLDESEKHEFWSFEKLSDEFQGLGGRMSPKRITMSRLCAGFDSAVVVLEDGRVFPYMVQPRFYGPLQALARFVVTKISFGKDFFVALSADGKLWSCGVNSSGQLGRGSVHNHFGNLGGVRGPPCRIADVCCGEEHTILLTDAGDVYTWGNGFHGQLGTGQSLQVVPRYVSAFPKETRIKTIAAGSFFCMALSDQDKIFAWGDGICYQLGRGRKTKSSYPEAIAFQGSVRQLVCGYGHAAALKTNGEVYTWGFSTHGQLGHGDFKRRAEPTKVQLDEPCKEIACGPFSTFFLTSSGKLLACGNNNAGQTGVKEKYQTSVVSPVHIVEHKHVSTMQACATTMIALTGTLITSCSSPVVSSEGGTSLILSGYGIPQDGRNAIVRFSVKNDMTIDGTGICTSEGIKCTSPDVSAAPLELYPLTLEISVSLDEGISFSESYAIAVYRNPKSFEEAPILWGPISGQTSITLSIDLDDVPYIQTAVQLCPIDPNVALPDPAPAVYDAATSKISFTTAPIASPCECVFSLTLDGEHFLKFEEGEVPRFYYYDAVVLQVTPLSFPWTGGKLVATVSGIDNIPFDKLTHFAPIARFNKEHDAMALGETKGIKLEGECGDGVMFQFDVPSCDPKPEGQLAEVKVALNGSNLINGDTFEYCWPTPTSIFPSSGPSGGSCQVEIAGNGFYSGSSVRVRFHSAEEAVQDSIVEGQMDAKTGKIRFTTPQFKAGTTEVAVCIGDEKASFSVSNVSFAFYDLPTAMKLDATSGPLEGGAVVRMTGKGLINIPGIRAKFKSTITTGDAEQKVEEFVDVQAAEEEQGKKGPPAVVYTFSVPSFAAYSACKAELELAINGQDFISTGCTYTYTVPK